MRDAMNNLKFTHLFAYVLLAIYFSPVNASEVIYTKEQYVDILGQLAIVDLCSDQKTLKNLNLEGDCYQQSETKLPICLKNIEKGIKNFDGKVMIYHEHSRYITVLIRQCLVSHLRTE
jgi:hypothetical protein